jgi:hypothetical protein
MRIRTGSGAVIIGVVVAMALPAAAVAAGSDANHDGLPDRWERAHRLPLRAGEARRDEDHDGLRNAAEYAARTNPRAADTDHDGVGDGAEDADRDHLTNSQEVVVGTSPRLRDTDHDGTGDAAEDKDHDGLDNGDEFRVGDDPRNADSDHDGRRDGEEGAATVASFDAATMTLVLTRLDGSSLTLSLAPDVRVEADNADRAGDDHQAATTAALVAGAIVKEYEVDEASGLVSKVELANHADQEDGGGRDD